MPDYNNGKIYCIRSHKTDQIYIGSTTQTLCRRLSYHRTDYKRYKNGKYNKYATSFEIIKLGDAYIELLEICPCSCRQELHKIEGGYVRKMKCVNRYIPGRTRREYEEDCKKEKDMIDIKRKERQRKYYQLNKDKINQKNRERYKKNKKKRERLQKEKA